MWQWMNGSVVDTLKGKQITFTFQFCPESTLQNSSYYMEAGIWHYDSAELRCICGNPVYYNQTIWYTATVTANLPLSTHTGIQLSIYGRPEFTGWTDNPTLTIQ